jgi:hypothetical protein
MVALPMTLSVMVSTGQTVVADPLKQMARAQLLTVLLFAVKFNAVAAELMVEVTLVMAPGAVVADTVLALPDARMP